MSTITISDTQQKTTNASSPFARGAIIDGKRVESWNAGDSNRLSEPLHWRKPRRVFVNSMSDLFHEDVPNEYIAAVFGVMAKAWWHTFQVLTKRPERAAQWFTEYAAGGRHVWEAAQQRPWPAWAFRAAGRREYGDRWPLPNVWLGVSVEDQDAADARIPHLLRVPAAVRFLSVEPLLGPVDLSRVVDEVGWRCGNDVFARRLRDCIECGGTGWHEPQGPQTRACRCRAAGHSGVGLDWVIVGGESGPGARPCDVAWVRSVVRQCRDAQVACFVKQLGARPMLAAQAPVVEQSAESIARHGEYDPDPIEYRFNNRKGGDPAEWPEDLRVREWPRSTP